MLHHTKGIVLRTTPYSESSVVVLVYTEKFGRQTYIINGVRSARSKGKSALYQHGNLLDMVVYHKETGDIFRVSEASIAHAYTLAPFDIVRSSIMLFLVELMTRAISETEANEELFRFCWQAFLQLDRPGGQLSLYPHRYMLIMSRYLGFEPHSGSGHFFDMLEGHFSDSIPRHTHYMEAELSSAFRSLLSDDIQFRPTVNTRRSLLHYLIIYYQLHLSGFGKMHSPDILEDVLRD